MSSKFRSLIVMSAVGAAALTGAQSASANPPPPAFAHPPVHTPIRPVRPAPGPAPTTRPTNRPQTPPAGIIHQGGFGQQGGQHGPLPQPLPQPQPLPHNGQGGLGQHGPFPQPLPRPQPLPQQPHNGQGGLGQQGGQHGPQPGGNPFPNPVVHNGGSVPAPHVVDAHSFGNHGAVTVDHPTHISPMAPAARIVPGTVVQRGEHVELHYGNNGAAEMYHRNANGQPVLLYRQEQLNDGGFHREYHVGGEIVNRYYAPVVWGSSSYTFYGYRPVEYSVWHSSGYFLFGGSYVTYGPGYYDWCHHYEWREGFEGWHYGWEYEGWRARPWWGYYGYYYTFYPEYRYPHYWVTDYYFGSLLGDYYAIREAEMAAEWRREYALDWQTKEVIRAEVEQSMLDQERGYVVPASQYLNQTFPASGAGYVFVVSEYTPVLNGDGYNCVLTPGDLISQASTVYEGQETIPMVVLRSKRGSCYPGSYVSVDASQLQEYVNDFNARVESGMVHMRERFWH